mgnify:FL=1|tara:strand:- start:179 stop:469 length:291 start_codon:yes stop_codon:yes gene_type:complete
MPKTSLPLKIAIAYYEDPAKVAIAVTIAVIAAATVVALSFLPVDTQEVLFGTFGSTLSALLAGLVTRKRAWSPASAEDEASKSYADGVRAGISTVN